MGEVLRDPLGRSFVPESLALIVGITAGLASALQLLSSGAFAIITVAASALALAAAFLANQRRRRLNLDRWFARTFLWWPPPIARNYPGLGEPGRSGYVPRGVDKQLDQALQLRRFVILAGDVKSGKSLSTLEAIRRNFPNHRVLVPRSGGNLLAVTAAIRRRVARPLPAILWLDDLDRFLASAPYGVRTLYDVVRNDDIVAVSTLRSEALARLSADARATPELRALLDGASVILIEDLTHAEERQLRASLAEQLPRPVGEEHAAAVAMKAIDALERGDLAAAEATLDRASDAADSPWTRAFVAYTRHHVYTRSGRVNDAIAALQQTIALTDDVELTAPAHIALGNLLVYVGDVAGAIENLRLAQMSGVGDTRLVAELQLGTIHARQGNLEVAERSLRRALEAQEPLVRDRAALRLGQLLSQQHRIENARSAFATAAASADLEISSEARIGLADLLVEETRYEEAEEAFRELMRVELVDYATRAAMRLGGLLLSRGKGEDAASLYASVLRSGLQPSSGMAALSLASILMERDSLAEASQLLQLAIDAGDARTASRAWALRGHIAFVQGDLAEARSALEKAQEAGDEDTVHDARRQLEAVNERSNLAEPTRDLLGILTTRAGGLTAAELASAARQPPSVVATQLDLLVARGLVDCAQGLRGESRYRVNAHQAARQLA